MKLTLDCPNGEYRQGMKIWCKAVNGWCGNQYFKSCKGWWTLTETAKNCPKRPKPKRGQT